MVFVALVLVIKLSKGTWNEWLLPFGTTESNPVTTRRSWKNRLFPFTVTRREQAGDVPRATGCDLVIEKIQNLQFLVESSRQRRGARGDGGDG